jgi:nitroreductase
MVLDALRVMRERKCARGFLPNEVEDKKLKKILEAAIQAPSAGNLQSWEFIVVKDSDLKQKLVSAAQGQAFVGEAPVVIVVCANEERAASRYADRGKELYCIQDCAAATENMLIAAQALGMSGCWVGAFDEEKIRALFSLPGEIRPLAIVPIGYQSISTAKPQRLPLKDVVHFDSFP